MPRSFLFPVALAAVVLAPACQAQSNSQPSSQSASSQQELKVFDPTLIDKSVAEFGRVDVVCNVAGAMFPGLIEDLTDEKINEILTATGEMIGGKKK